MIVSPWAAYASTALLDSEKALIRQYCGYPPFGTGANGFQNWRFFQQDGLLEFRMNNFAPAEFQAVRGYVTNIILLEAAIPAASANLDTDSAAVWFHNKNEVRDRRNLYEYWRQELLTLVGVPAGPYKGGSGGSISLVV
jgi:hypothetical protein